MANEKGINVKFPLRAYRKGFFESNTTTLDAVREDIKILLLTRKGERVINPDIGTNISIFAGELFEQIDKKTMELRVKNEIVDALSKWMPHVKLTSLNIFKKDDDNVKARNLRDNDILISMEYVLVNAEALGDSVQLVISS